MGILISREGLRHSAGFFMRARRVAARKFRQPRPRWVNRLWVLQQSDAFAALSMNKGMKIRLIRHYHAFDIRYWREIPVTRIPWARQGVCWGRAVEFARPFGSSHISLTPTVASTTRIPFLRIRMALVL
jgi:hypothetical protein